MYFGVAEHPRGFGYPFFMGEKPAREKGDLKSPQAFQNPKLKIIFPLMMRKAKRSAFQIVFQYELSPRLTSSA